MLSGLKEDTCLDSNVARLKNQLQALPGPSLRRPGIRAHEASSLQTKHKSPPSSKQKAHRDLQHQPTRQGPPAIDKKAQLPRVSRPPFKEVSRNTPKQQPTLAHSPVTSRTKKSSHAVLLLQGPTMKDRPLDRGEKEKCNGLAIHSEHSIVPYGVDSSS